VVSRSALTLSSRAAALSRAARVVSRTRRAVIDARWNSDDSYSLRWLVARSTRRNRSPVLKLSEFRMVRSDTSLLPSIPIGPTCTSRRGFMVIVASPWCAAVSTAVAVSTRALAYPRS
jgi:hypothetical protein